MAAQEPSDERPQGDITTLETLIRQELGDDEAPVVFRPDPDLGVLIAKIDGELGDWRTMTTATPQTLFLLLYAHSREGSLDWNEADLLRLSAQRGKKVGTTHSQAIIADKVDGQSVLRLIPLKMRP